MPVANSHIVKSPLLEDELPFSVSSKHINSQHDAPIWNDLQSGGGVHNTALHDFACPISQTHNLHISGPENNGGTQSLQCNI